MKWFKTLIQWEQNTLKTKATKRWFWVHIVSQMCNDSESGVKLAEQLLWGFFQNWWMIWSDPPPLTSSSPPQTSGCCQAGLQAGQLIFQQVAPWKLNSIRSRCQISGLVRQWSIRHSHAVNTFTLPWKRQERIFGQKYRNRQRIGILALRHVAFMLQAICQDVCRSADVKCSHTQTVGTLWCCTHRNLSHYRNKQDYLLSLTL